MILSGRIALLGAAVAIVASTGACSSGLGNILGSVLGGGGGGQPQSGQLSGTVRGIDTRNQQLTIQQSNGQSVAVMFDNQTRVVYQNQTYSVANLEYGDQVTASIRQAQNGYYTDYVQVDRSVSTSGSSGNVQQIQGNVRQVDSRSGLFTVESGNSLITVSMPYNARSTDVTRFQRLRPGDYVRFYGVFLNNSRVELRQFN